MNAKNGFGGYKSFKHFIVLVRHGKLPEAFIAEGGREQLVRDLQANGECSS